jgi:thioredoxin-related protein
MRAYLILLFFSAFPLSLMAGEPAGSVSFFKGEFEKLQTLAQKEGKPFFLSFQDEGIPSQNMDHYTFRDPQIVGYVAKHYLAKKVIAPERTRGMDPLLSEYDVLFYPTLIIFSPQGERRHKFTGYVTPTNLLNALQRFRLSPAWAQLEIEKARVKPWTVEPATPSHDNQEATPPNEFDIFPSAGQIDVTHIPAPDHAANRAIEPGFLPTEIPVHSVVPSEPRKESSVRNATKITPKNIERIPIVPVPTKSREVAPRMETNVKPLISEVIPEGASALTHFQIRLQDYEGMAIQTGVFGNYQNALREITRVEKRYRAPVLVHIDKLGSQTVFRVLLGPYSTHEAKTFLRSYNQKERERGILKDLEDLKN